MWYGWMQIPDDAGDVIIRCNVLIKDRNEDGSYNVEVGDEDFYTLNKYWGRVVWGLKHKGD